MVQNAAPGRALDGSRERTRAGSMLGGPPQRLRDSAPAMRDSRGRPLPHAPWGRTVEAPGEVWLIGIETTRSWDSRYFGPVPLDHVHAVRPVLTLGGGR